MVACLAWEDCTTRHSRVKKEVLQSLKAFFQDKMTNAPTNTFKNRNKSAVVGKSAEDQAKVAFVAYLLDLMVC